MFVAVEAANGFPRTGKLVSSHPANPNYVYIEDEWGCIDGGIMLPTFCGPFKEAQT